MTRQQLTMIFAVCFGMAVGVSVGPIVGDFVTGSSDSLFFEILPWMLIIGIWIVLLRYLRRVPPAS